MVNWTDFYDILAENIKSNSVNKLISKLNGDQNISLLLAQKNKIIRIKPQAFYERLSGENSLEYIFNRTKQYGFEIPFSGLIDESTLTIHRIFKGCDGNNDCCDWTKENLINKSKEHASKKDLKVALGHTHPVFLKENGKISKAYGALCSKIYYSEEELERFGDRISKQILDSELYKKYGGDYCEMFMRSKGELMSDYFFIMSPRLEQLGIFRIEEDGKITYYKWVINKL
jgi:hypothetical protein